MGQEGATGVKQSCRSKKKEPPYQVGHGSDQQQSPPETSTNKASVENGPMLVENHQGRDEEDVLGAEREQETAGV